MSSDARNPAGAPTAMASQPVWAIGLAGAAALAVAMGIGRFVFTPLLPLMQREGLIDADGGALLAAANYLGYLVGALSAARVPVAPRTLVLGALLGTALLTAATGALQGLTAWWALRFMAGVMSAWALVGVGAWAVPMLAQRGRADAAGAVFAGVGLGIALAGGWVWALSAQPAAALWWQMGGLALALAGLVAGLWPRTVSGAAPGQAPEPAPGPASAPAPAAPGSALLVACYGLLGFGYILPATYLPALARGLVDDPRLFGAVWPVFGLAAAVSTLLAGRLLRRWSRLTLWSAGHGVMAVGCVLPLLTRSAAGLALAALCVGGTFMVVTMVGLQQARAQAPARPAVILGRMTAAFAAGQIAGPLVALGLSRLAPAGWSGIELTLALAAALLLASAAVLAGAARGLGPGPQGARA